MVLALLLRLKITFVLRVQDPTASVGVPPVSHKAFAHFLAMRWVLRNRPFFPKHVSYRVSAEL